MSFPRLFSGGTPRRGAARPPAERPPATEPAEERISSRLNRLTAPARKGLPSEFVPEELGSMFVTSRTVSLEQAEGRSRPV